MLNTSRAVDALGTSAVTIEQAPVFSVLGVRAECFYQGVVSPADCRRFYDTSGIHLVARHAGELCGVVSVWPEAKTFTLPGHRDENHDESPNDTYMFPNILEASHRIAYLAVVPRWRNCGASRLLLTHAMQLALSNGAVAVWGSVPVASVARFESLGAHAVGVEYPVTRTGEHRDVVARIG